MLFKAASITLAKQQTNVPFPPPPLSSQSTSKWSNRDREEKNAGDAHALAESSMVYHLVAFLHSASNRTARSRLRAHALSFIMWIPPKNPEAVKGTIKC